jgi:hypothetical protein
MVSAELVPIRRPLASADTVKVTPPLDHLRKTDSPTTALLSVVQVPTKLTTSLCSAYTFRAVPANAPTAVEDSVICVLPYPRESIASKLFSLVPLPVPAAVKSNAAHGLRRSTADKRRAVEMLLDHPVHGKHGKQKIADLAGVSKPMVMDVIARREGTTTTTDRKQARQPSRVESTPLPSKLPKSLVKLVNMMTDAGIHPDQIKAVIARTLADRPQRQPVRRRSDAERLQALAEKVGQRAGKVITIIAEDASSRTKRYAKIQGRIT